MIDNVMLLLKGTLSGRSASELIEQCHPLGLFKVRRLSIMTHSLLLPVPLFIGLHGISRGGEKLTPLIINQMACREPVVS